MLLQIDVSDSSLLTTTTKKWRNKWSYQLSKSNSVKDHYVTFACNLEIQRSQWHSSSQALPSPIFLCV